MNNLTSTELEYILKTLTGKKFFLLRKFQEEICQQAADYELLHVQAEEIRKIDALITKLNDDLGEPNE